MVKSPVFQCRTLTGESSADLECLDQSIVWAGGAGWRLIGFLVSNSEKHGIINWRVSLLTVLSLLT